MIEYPAAKTGWYPRISPKWYHPSDITQLSKLPSVTISLLSKIHFKMRKRFVVVTEEGRYFFVHKVCIREHSKAHISRFIQSAVRSQFFTLVGKYLKDNKHSSLYLGTDNVCGQTSISQRPLWEPPISAPYLTPFLAKGPPKMKEGDPLSPLRPISSIKGLSF